MTQTSVRFPALRLSSRALAKGWHVVGACSAMTAVAHGVGAQTHGMWIVALASVYPWSRATVSLGATLFHLCAGGVGIAAGRLLDHYGPRPLLFAGALALALGSLTLAAASALWHVYVGFVLLGGGFAALGPLLLGKLIAPLFAGEQRTWAMTLATLGTNIGAFTVPLTTTLLVSWGRPSVGILLALLTLGVMGTCMYVLRESAVEVPPSAPVPLPAPGGQLAAAIKQRSYWALALSLFFVVMAQAGYVSHALLIYGKSLGLTTSAWLWVLSASMGTVSRLAMLLLRPKAPPRQLASGIYGAQALAFGLLACSPHVPAFALAGAVGIGLTASLTITLEPLLASACFHAASYGSLYGPIYAGTRLAAALGALVYGLSVTLTGTYTLVLWVMAGALLVAAATIQLATPLPALGDAVS